jgi:foldase protein PrsA
VKQTKVLKRGALLLAGALTIGLAGCGGQSGGGGGASGGSDVAAVNGQTITRTELQSYAEAKAGAEALAELIDYNLILAELKNRGLEVKDEEVDADLKARQSAAADPRVAQQLSRMLAQEGVAKEALQRQSRLRLALEKILTKDIKVSDTELKSWFEKNKATAYPDKVKLAMLVSSQKARTETMARQLSGKTKTFKELVDEQKKLKDEIGQGSTMDTPLLVVSEMPEPLKSAVTKLKAGETSPILTLKAPAAPGAPASPSAYALVRVEERQSTSFETLRPSLEMDYKLEQLARREQKKSAPQMTWDQALASVRQQAPPGTAPRDIYRALIQSAEQSTVEELRKKANVQINDQFYRDLQMRYGAGPAPGSISPANGGPGGAPAGGNAPAGAPAGGAPAGGNAPAPPAQ